MRTVSYPHKTAGWLLNTVCRPKDLTLEIKKTKQQQQKTKINITAETFKFTRQLAHSWISIILPRHKWMNVKTWSQGLPWHRSKVQCPPHTLPSINFTEETTGGLKPISKAVVFHVFSQKLLSWVSCNADLAIMNIKQTAKTTPWLKKKKEEHSNWTSLRVRGVYKKKLLKSWAEMLQSYTASLGLDVTSWKCPSMHLREPNKMWRF